MKLQLFLVSLCMALPMGVRAQANSKGIGNPTA